MAEDVALLAFLPSTVAASDLNLLILTPSSVEEGGIVFALEEWKARVDPSAATPTAHSAHRQKDWDTPMSRFSRDALLARADQRQEHVYLLQPHHAAAAGWM